MSAETVGARLEPAAPVVWGEGALAVRRPPRAPSVTRTGPAVSEARIGVIVTKAHRTPRAWRRLLTSRAVRTHFGTVAGAVILAVLLWRMGTGVFLDGLRRIDVPTLLTGLAIGAVTTVFSAWRWALVARGLRIRLPFGAAVADYYRALFLNAALPGGILGDVHRAVRHGQSAGDVGRGVRAVVLERTAGQLALAAAGVTVLLVLPSPVMDDMRSLAPLVLPAGVGTLAVVLALRMNSSARRPEGRFRKTLAEAREGLLSRRNGPGVALSSLVVLAGYVAMFVLSARVVGASASVLTLLPIAMLALLAMGVPLNVGGWGPREGVTAWAFGAAGLGASTGLSVAVVYGVLSFVAALPGAVVLVVRWYASVRAGSTAGVAEAVGASDGAGATGGGGATDGAGATGAVGATDGAGATGAGEVPVVAGVSDGAGATGAVGVTDVAGSAGVAEAVRVSDGAGATGAVGVTDVAGSAGVAEAVRVSDG
ncbi:YbhN family protein, partial [Streptomyces sp. NPDC096132]|uniref:lysylphosphatidylglycerol synthase transmembrane domain-containing protein n=1 Tax=Streptomyces sp. NPDC096132 TaxID=3366075 RepID=UPI00380D4752